MKTAKLGLKSEAPNPCRPFLNAYRITVPVKNVSSPARAQAPRIETHLPTRNERIADSIVNQMKTMQKMYFTGSDILPTKVSTEVAAVIVSVPPIQIGFESQ